MSYNNTKLMQIAFIRLHQQHFDRKSHANGQVNRRTAHCFTPGFTLTPMVDKLTIRSLKEDPVWWVLQTAAILATDPSQGAATGTWHATTHDKAEVGEGKGGTHWDRMVRGTSKIDVMDPDVVQRFGFDGKAMLGSSGASLVDIEQRENEGSGSGQIIYATKDGITGLAIA